MGNDSSLPSSSRTNAPRLGSAVALDLSLPPVTPEGHLNHRLLSSDPSHRLLILHGMGGCGKTTLVCYLSHHSPISSFFSHGCCFIPFSPTSTFATFAHIIHTFAAADLLQKPLSHPSLTPLNEALHTDLPIADVADRLVQFLTTYQILLVLDDVWAPHPDPRLQSLLSNLASSILDSSASSKILITTRDSHLLAAHQPSTLHLPPREPFGSASNAILNRYAYPPPQTAAQVTPETAAARDTILGRCDGLPLALSVAGSSIRELLLDTPSAWQYYAAELAESTGELGHHTDPNYPRELFQSLTFSIRLLEARWNESWDVSPSAAFEALAVLPKGVGMPLPALSRLWKVELWKARKVLQKLAELSLVSIVGGRSVQVHDLVHDYCFAVAARHNSLHGCHATLADGYKQPSVVTLTNPNRSAAKDLGAINEPWWQRHDQDEYFVENIVHHLVGALYIDQVCSLLTDFRWIKKNVEHKNTASLNPIVRGFKLLSSNIKYAPHSPQLIDDLSYEVDLILSSLELCVTNDPTRIEEYAFQLFGRFEGLPSPRGLIRRLVWSIEMFAPRPWARPMPGSMTRAMGRLRKELKFEMEIGCDEIGEMEVSEEDDEVIVGLRNGNVVVFSFVTGTVMYILYGHKKHVSKIMRNRYRREILTFSFDGSVRVWVNGRQTSEFHPFGEEDPNEIGKDFEKSHALRGGCFVPMTPLVICLSMKGEVRIIDLQKQDARSDIIQSMPVLAVAAGRNGDFFVVVTKETISRWNVDKRTCDMEKNWEKSFEFLDSNGGGCCCIAIGGHDETVALATSNAKIFLVETKDGSLHERHPQISSKKSYYIVHLALSADGTRLIALMQYTWSIGFVHVWDGFLGDHTVHQWECNACRIAVSNDFKYVYATPRSNSLKAWRVEIPSGLDGEDERLEGSERLEESGTVNGRYNQMDQRETFGMFKARAVRGFGISNDEKMFVTVDSTNFRVWDSATLELCFEERVTPHATNFFAVLVAISDGADQFAICKQNYGFWGESENKDLWVWTNPKSQQGNSSSGALHTNFRGTGVQGDNWEQYKLPSGCEWYAEELRFKNCSGEHALCLRSSVFKTWETVQWNWTLGVTERSEAAKRTKFDEQLFNSSGRNRPGKGLNFIRGGNLIFDSVKGVNFSYGLSDRTMAYGQYLSSLKRLWLKSKDGRMQYVDFVTSTSDVNAEEGDDSRVLVPPVITSTSNEVVGADAAKYVVFLSHSGHDKETMAVPLSRMLEERGIRTFLDKKELRPGQIAPDAMIHAMETSPVGVFLLSPDFLFKKWTMMELMCFQRRKRAALQSGQRIPVLLPVFYRLDIRQCTDRTFLMQQLDEDGQLLYEKYGFRTREMREQISMDILMDSMHEIKATTGVENVKIQAGFGDSWDMKQRREKLMVEIVDAVQEIMRQEGLLPAAPVDEA